MKDLETKLKQLIQECTERGQLNEAWFIPKLAELFIPKQELSRLLEETEKAFGGCKKCYGKGYATARVGHSSRYGNKTYDTIKYCSCDRGTQLAELKKELGLEEK